MTSSLFLHCVLFNVTARLVLAHLHLPASEFGLTSTPGITDDYINSIEPNMGAMKEADSESSQSTDGADGADGAEGSGFEEINSERGFGEMIGSNLGRVVGKTSSVVGNGVLGAGKLTKTGLHKITALELEAEEEPRKGKMGRMRGQGRQRGDGERSGRIMAPAAMVEDNAEPILGLQPASFQPATQANPFTANMLGPQAVPAAQPVMIPVEEIATPEWKSWNFALLIIPFLLAAVVLVIMVV